METNVFNLLSKVYGARGLPFPRPPLQGNGTAIATPFKEQPLTGSGTAIAGSSNDYDPVTIDATKDGLVIKQYEDELLGTYVFLPATLNGQNLPNAIVIITGEKNIVETDIVDVGTVFEKVFTRPYNISIIVTLIGEKNSWPLAELKKIKDLWLVDAPLTLRCALTDIFLQPANNFILKSIAVLDNQGSENVEVMQLDGMSNIDFKLEIV